MGKLMNPKTTGKKDGKVPTTAQDEDGDACVCLTVIASPDSEPSPTIISAAIKTMEEDMNARFNHLDSSLQSVQTSLAEHTTHIIDLEGNAGDHETCIATLEGQYEELLNLYSKIAILALNAPEIIK